MCVCVFVCMYACEHVNIYTCNIYEHVYIYTRNVCVYLQCHKSRGECHVCMHVCVHVNMYIYIYICITYMNMYIHICVICIYTCGATRVVENVMCVCMYVCM